MVSQPQPLPTTANHEPSAGFPRHRLMAERVSRVLRLENMAVFDICKISTCITLLATEVGTWWWSVPSVTLKIPSVPPLSLFSCDKSLGQHE